MFFKVKVRNKVYKVPNITKQEVALTTIDFLALQFYNTESPKDKEVLFEKLLEVAQPYINSIATSFTKTTQAKDDLMAVLITDLWRLLKSWKPNMKYMLECTMKKNASCRFHYLMLRQLRNKSLNEVKKKQRPQSNKRYVDLNQAVSIEDLPEAFEKLSCNVLRNISQNDFVKKVLENVKDEKTRKILELVVHDASTDEIKSAINGKALRAIKRRQESCRPVIISLLTEAYSTFMKRLTSRINDETERMIICKYCAGKDAHEIKTSLNLTTKVVKKCIEKYKPLIMTLLLGD